ncbi:MAG TPA: tetratricopeptide repeat protein [Burkholderiaceae bacterium]|nr:tetratricopeptide repeat protein [Burkholderiaceae bacterium]
MLGASKVLASNIRPDTAARSRLQIGDWWVDPAANELGRTGETVRVEPKAMQVLTALADGSGRVVSREELLSGVWPGVIVGDEALTQTIIKLRKALGDNPRAPSYIETISKRGYRLIAPVQASSVTNLPAAMGDKLPVQSSARERGVPWSGLIGVLLVVAVVVGYYFYSAAQGDSSPINAEPAEERQSAPLTVTILPFESLGSDGDHAYLAGGISNDLMTDLSRLPGLRLIRPASETPNSSSGARYLVAGSVQRESGELRINIRLVDTATNEQLWSERFVRPFGDLFAVQDEIVRRLTELLPGKITDAERQRLANRYTRSLEAYDHFLRAQALFLIRQAGVNEEARNLYRKALDLDPKFARAYAGLAMTYAMDHRLRPPGEASTALARAFELAESARMIDPEIPEVYWALAFVHVQSRRHEQAIESLQRAIELNRSFADAYAFMGGVYDYIGESSKSIPLLRTALRLNPDGGYLYYQILGRAYLFDNDIEQALINLREAVARNPVDLETRVHLAAALVASGDRAAAEWEAVEIRSLQSDFVTRSWLQTYPLTSPKHRERLLHLLGQVGL